MSYSDHTRDTIYSIQVLRGIAVILVVLFHATQLFANIYQIKPLNGLLLFGFSGVHLFFVLSGFIIFTIHYSDIDQPRKYLSYIIKRFIRIYPLYWITLLIVLVLVPNGIVNITMYNFFANISLLIEPIQFINPVSWTLLLEVLFYIIFSMLIINKIIGILLLFIWIAGIATINLLDIVIPFLSTYVFHKYTVLFIIGLTVGYTVTLLKYHNLKIKNKIAYIGCSSGIALFVITSVYDLYYAIIDWNLWSITLGFGLSSGLFMTCVLSNRMEIFFQNRTLLIHIGNSSYSIYLLHFILLHAGIAYLKQLFPMAGIIFITTAFVLISILVILLGWIFHLSVERPVLKFMRNKLLGNLER